MAGLYVHRQMAHRRRNASDSSTNTLGEYARGGRGMIKPYLTDPEILEIASPLTQRAAIVRWFKNNGFGVVRVRPNGMPLIMRSALEQIDQKEASNDSKVDVAAYLRKYGKDAKQKASA
jgi:hypothetical protein